MDDFDYTKVGVRLLTGNVKEAAVEIYFVSINETSV